MRRVMLCTAATAILAFSAGPVMARGEGGGGRGGDGGRGGEVHAGGEVHVGAPNGQVHVAPNAGARVDGNIGTRRVAPNVIPHEGDRNDYFGHEGRADGWRYRYDNGLWWYYLPGNRWTYYDNGDWQNYADTTATYDNSNATALDVPSDPNYYWYNNQWWYWTPGANRWNFYDHGGWRDAAPGMGPQRRETGFRGPLSEGHGSAIENRSGAENRGASENRGTINNATPHVDTQAPSIRGPVGGGAGSIGGPRK